MHIKPLSAEQKQAGQGGVGIQRARGWLSPGHPVPVQTLQAQNLKSTWPSRSL